jgi:hypothetical protein
MAFWKSKCIFAGAVTLIVAIGLDGPAAAVAQTGAQQYIPPAVELHILYSLNLWPNQRYARFFVTRFEGDTVYLSRSAWEDSVAARESLIKRQ